MIRAIAPYLDGLNDGRELFWCPGERGSDVLAAFAVAAQVMDKELETGYTDRVRQYQKPLRKKDLAITAPLPM